MKTNLIQSYNPQNIVSQQYNSDKIKNDFDINKELSNRTFIKPLPANGHLVKYTIFDYPSAIFKNVKYNAKSFVHALKGDAKDHELGKLNDVAMITGGLGIAGYLATKRQTPMTKAMEFIGLGSFFASMSIWPKVALQFPAYLIHGFDIRQQYRDNSGAKKPVFQDHQFIPWDLYSDDEINKIGDRMGVPRNMKNRRNFIEEKMRKIALQNNTMWMLTSGFATPIMSALICSAMEKPVRNFLNNRQNIKADKLLENFSDNSKKHISQAETQELTDLLTPHKNKQITPEIINTVSDKLATDFDAVTADIIRKDVKSIMEPKKTYVFNNETLEAIRNTFKDSLGDLKLSETEITHIIPTTEKLQELFNAHLSDNPINDFTDLTKITANYIESKIGELNQRNSNPLNDAIEFRLNKILHSPQPYTDSPIDKAFKVVSSNKLTEEMIKKLTSISKTLSTFKAKTYVLDTYAHIKAAQAPETVLANSWNDITESMQKIFNISSKEAENARYDRTYAAKLLKTKFEKIAVDEELYKKTIEALKHELIKLEQDTRFANIEGNSNNIYKKRVDSTFNEAASSLGELGMKETKRRLIGYKDNDATSLRNLQIDFVTDRVKGVKSSFYRILNTLDVFHRISNPENIEKLFEKDKIKPPRLVKEELVELMKEVLISGHSSDYAVKFDNRRLPIRKDTSKMTESEKRAYFGKVEIDKKTGALINKVDYTHEASEMVELANDKVFFEKAMRFMYETPLHSDTESKITGALFADNFKKYRQNVLEYVGGNSYFAKKYHSVPNAKNSSSELRFLLVGSATDEMFTKLFNNRFNRSKWLKIFGISGSVLLGTTVLSQFLFGKMPIDKSRLIQEDKK